MILEVAALSDVGKRRENNEDSLALRPDLGLFIVADGMGGHAGGEVASATAVQAVCDFDGAADEAPDGQDPELFRILAAIQHANGEVWRKAQSHPFLHNMGTTVVALRQVADDEFVVGHLGDSRCYHLSAGGLAQVTEDHNLASDFARDGLISKEEARTSPYRHVIGRACGLTTSCKPDASRIKVAAGDWLLLCSDGLTNELDDDAIRELVSDASSADEATKRLVWAALECGGRDNVTVVAIRVLP